MLQKKVLTFIFHLRLDVTNFLFLSSFANKTLYNLISPRTCYMAHPSNSSPFDHPNKAARNNGFLANFSDIASSCCDALT